VRVIAMVTSAPSLAASAAPIDFPLPSHHPWIRLSGLHAWFLRLSHEDSYVFHRFLLNFDINQQSPTEALYTKPVSTADAIAVYDMASTAGRIAFDELVRWSGIPDTRPLPPPLKESVGVLKALLGEGPTSLAPDTALAHSVPGYDCYGVLFRDTALADVRERLGVNPWASAVAAELLSAPGVWSEGRFVLQFGLPLGPSPRGSPAFVQAHVAPSDHGMPVRQLLPMLTGLVRLGATDLAAALSIAEQSEAPAIKSAFDLRPKSAGHKLTFGVYGIVAADIKKHPSISFSPLSVPSLTLILGIYESVRLESASFTITVDKGSGNAVWCAMVSAGTTLKSEDDWYSAPVMATVDGSDSGVVRGTFDMPAVTMFAREYRASTLGNPPAKFVFSYTGVAETGGTIQGLFTVTVSGQRLLNRINIGGSSPLTAMKSLAHSVQRDLEYDVDDCDLAPRTGSALEELTVADDED